MIPRKSLSPTAREVIKQEAERIAALGDEWQSTYENLAAVIIRVQEVETEEADRKRIDGYNRALAASAFSPGRPPREIPEHFEEVHDRWFAGEITTREIAEAFHASEMTIRKWSKSLLLRRGTLDSSETTERRPDPRKKDMASDERCLLEFLRESSDADGIATIALKKIACAMGWSYNKAMKVRDRLKESGRLEAEICRAEDTKLRINGYRITEAGWQFLGESHE